MRHSDGSRGVDCRVGAQCGLWGRMMFGAESGVGSEEESESGVESGVDFLVDGVGQTCVRQG